MKQYLLFLAFCFVAISVKAQPPNNLIFYGGGGDGATKSSFFISAVNIYNGGAGDGEAYASNNLLPNTIFYGGEGDGFSNGVNASQPNSIFTGGSGDGFSYNMNTSFPNNIFNGGAGDGWSAVIFPLGPLPVELLNFDAHHEGSGHLLKWTTTDEINTAHFEVQRSSDGRSFSRIGQVTATGGNSVSTTYRFRVEEPLEGNNFYRLKIIDTDGSFTYSNIVLLVNEGEIQFSVFPNPTADILNIKLSATAENAVVKGTVYDQQGKLVMLPLIELNGVSRVNVSKLSVGMYTLRFKAGNKLFVFRFLKQE